jgi:hypothetical protein
VVRRALIIHPLEGSAESVLVREPLERDDSAINGFVCVKGLRTRYTHMQSALPHREVPSANASGRRAVLKKSLWAVNTSVCASKGRKYCIGYDASAEWVHTEAYGPNSST